jgi:hypothetical protein
LIADGTGRDVSKAAIRTIKRKVRAGDIATILARLTQRGRVFIENRQVAVLVGTQNIPNFSGEVCRIFEVGSTIFVEVGSAKRRIRDGFNPRVLPQISP